MRILTTALRVLAGTRVRALLSLGMVLGLGAVGTLAAWSTSATATSGQFTTGTVDITINDNQGTVASPYVFPMTPTTPLVPGGSSAGMIAVRNVGSLDFTYNVRVSGTGALTTALTAGVRVGGSVSGGTCTGGTVLAEGVPIPVGTPAAIGGESAKLGKRTGVVNLCVQVGLPTTAPNSVQGQSSTVTLLFTATGASGA